MTESPFATPSASEGIKWSDLNGSLVLIEVLGTEAGIQTVHGSTDAVRANISVLDGGLSGDRYDDALIFPRVLQGQVRSKVGQLVLGRVGQGVAKPGQTAPWKLAEATPSDVSKAEAHMRNAPRTPAVTNAEAPF